MPRRPKSVKPFCLAPGSQLQTKKRKVCPHDQERSVVIAPLLTSKSAWPLEYLIATILYFIQLAITDAMSLAAGAKKEDASSSSEVAKATIFDESLKCTMCMELCNRPVTVRLFANLHKQPWLCQGRMQFSLNAVQSLTSSCKALTHA